MSEPLQSVTSECNYVEVIPKDHGGMQQLLAIKSSGVWNMEVDPFDVQELPPKNFIATSYNIQDILEDTSGMQLSLGSIEGGHVEVCNVEEQISLPEFTISESLNIGKDDYGAEVQPEVGSSKGEYVAGCGAGANLSEALTSMPNDIVEKSTDIEDTHRMEAWQFGGGVLRNISKNSRPSSLAVEEEKVDACEKGLAGNSLAQREPQGSEA
ncbi:uncharacterized protein LOC131179120 [Hevea brasiliensis]|uniref:uncharacterized protein LOC131179120 n=1 Tax=Hevea brasiliensis TaxID=3981 RepID=UPI0025CF28C8|nr:uncharacterized protein LOC131179120 [Hevea brasiliensis]